MAQNITDIFPRPTKISEGWGNFLDGKERKKDRDFTSKCTGFRFSENFGRIRWQLVTDSQLGGQREQQAAHGGVHRDQRLRLYQKAEFLFSGTVLLLD